MYRNPQAQMGQQPQGGGGMGALRDMRGANQQGRSEMSRYSGPDARPANPPQQSGTENLREMLTQQQPRQQMQDPVDQMGQMPPQQGQMPPQQGPQPNSMAMQRANEHARFMGRWRPTEPVQPMQQRIEGTAAPTQQRIEGTAQQMAQPVQPYMAAPASGQEALREQMAPMGQPVDREPAPRPSPMGRPTVDRAARNRELGMRRSGRMYP